MKQFSGVVLALALSIPAVWGAESRDTLVRNDRSDVLASGKWIYNDFKKGREEAISSGKPMLVVVRCIPCTACKGFDARVLSYDPQIEDLMKKFVCVRIVQGNGLDLELFEHDYDLSFAAYFLNPDKTIYGRFGSRSDHKEAERDISIEGFRKAMLAAIDLHDKYPANKDVLKKKGGSTPRYASPEFYPRCRANIRQSSITRERLRGAASTATRSAKRNGWCIDRPMNRFLTDCFIPGRCPISWVSRSIQRKWHACAR